MSNNQSDIKMSEGWYWISTPSEGDVFYPAYVCEDGTYKIDDITMKHSHTGLTFDRAISPIDHDRLVEESEDLRQSLQSANRNNRELLKYKKETEKLKRQVKSAYMEAWHDGYSCVVGDDSAYSYGKEDWNSSDSKKLLGENYE